MRLAIESFRGEVPRISKRLLPENAASSAINARLQSGDLQSWRQFNIEKVLANGADVETIYLLNDKWLSWTADVDVARGPIPGDNTYRTYLTGPDLYSQPRFTNYALATTGAEPFPVTTRPLGVPAPDSQPTCTPGISTLPTSNTTSVLDNGDQLSTSWSTSSSVSTAFTRSIVGQSASVGNAAPSYYIQVAENNDFPGYLFRDYGIDDAQVAEISFDFEYAAATSYMQLLCNVLASSTGAGIGIFVSPTTIQIGVAPGFNLHGYSSLAGAGLSLSPSTVYTVLIQVITNTQGSRTVTAQISLGSVQLASITATNAFPNRGGIVGFVQQIAEPKAGGDSIAYVDNILVQSTPPTTPVEQEATSYVYTFVNDLGEESAPSPPSATLLKDDGTAITVVSMTAVQSGYSVDYAVETKRIYRAASGSTGTAFLFVAEIPLSQAEYIDELTDSELGDPIETDLYALPPDDLKGLLALPNGVMVGFRRNQLCFSAQNRPHAWPVEWRLNTDTDIAGIGAIDTTVVIGTKSFPYLAIGNDPSAYSMTKLEVPQACISKRSVAYLTGIGVVFASPDGLIAVSGNGNVRNLTESMFTRRQWRALLPASIIAAAHDDVYHFWYDTENVAAGGAVFSFNITPYDLTLEHAVSYVPGPATTSATCVPLNQWTLIELRRTSGLVELLANDVVRASQSGYNQNVGNGSRPYDIGSFDNAQEFFVGYIDRVRASEAGSSKLSINFDGPDGSSAFTDNAGSTLTGSGGVTQTNAQAYNGSFSANYAAGGRNIRSSTFCSIGTGDFSFSAAVYPTAYVPTTGGRVISAQNQITIDPLVALRVSSAGRLTALMRNPSGLNQLVLTSSDAVAGPFASMTASESIGLSISASGLPSGTTAVLVWDGTSGTVGLTGTPPAANTYTISITYTNTTTNEVVGTSTHTLVVT